MECQATESKKLFKTFDASRRKKSRKKREARDDSNSVPTDGSTSGGRLIANATSARSLHALTPTNDPDGARKRDRGSSSDLTRTLADEQCSTRRSSRRHKRHSRHHHRDVTSLALKAGIVSTPRSNSPSPDANATMEVPRDEDSFIYTFLEDAIKKDKKKHRQRNAKKQGERDRGDSPEHEPSPSTDRTSRRQQRKNDTSPSHDQRRKRKEEPPEPVMDQKVLIKAFAKLCEQINGNTEPVRTRSNKSLHCGDDVRGRDSREPDKCLRSREHSRDTAISPRSRSHDLYRNRERRQSTEKIAMYRERKEDIDLENRSYHDIEKLTSKMDVQSRRNLAVDRYPEERPPIASQTRSRLNTLSYCRVRPADYSYKDREYDERRCRHYKEEGKSYCEQKSSRSFDIHRDPYMEDDRSYRRTSRSDTKDKNYYPDARYDDKERKHVDREQSYTYYDRPLEVREKCSTLGMRDKHRSKRLTDLRHGREDDYRDRYSERERDSGLSVADEETSTVSGRSTYFRVVKQEISEQREAMDKMMKLWKDLMKCFKGIQQPTDQHDKQVTQAENARDSAAAQLQLWRECMRRYETVARDVGDTDARLMDEINKQRSEMAEMATMWQECLQRYRDMSKDFNNLKEKIAVEAPRTTPPAVESERAAAASAYRVLPSYPQPPPMLPYSPADVGSPLRARASAPPPWQWWGHEAPHEPAPRRRRQSSPESRGSRERRHRRKDRDRDDTRCKEKCPTSSAPRSDNRRRKR